MKKFKVHSNYKPTGDQPEAIKQLTAGFSKYPQQTLLGVTGSGKTYTIANVIEKVQKPTLVISHNKTLAAQLYGEFKEFFPENKVGFFISYYDYYQPESYLPTTDTFIEKETQVNEKIEQFRLEAASSLVSRNDVIIVASVSCIYGLGSPQQFKKESRDIHVGQEISKNDLLRQFVGMQYERSDMDLRPGQFRAKGDTIELIQGFGQHAYRIELFGDEIERITERELITNTVIRDIKSTTIFPARPFVVGREDVQRAMQSIREELAIRVTQLDDLSAHRLKQRTLYDLEMLEELGYCKGVENYSRHFDQRAPGTPPQCLIDFFPDDFLMIIDESHVTVPQIRGMYNGDQARKKNLIDYGFRLPSAADNRPLQFNEFEKYMRHVIHVSATPAEYELQHSGAVVEQIIRPTFLIDPEITIHPSAGQIDHLIGELKTVIAQGNRAFVTVLTKRMAEDLTGYLEDAGLLVRYLHSEIDTMERSVIIRDLRLGVFDVLVGINLLREGLDIPEVGLVAILDADKEGFLRNARSLIQTSGRAARNIHGRVILYADEMTKSIKETMRETQRRRKKQLAYNAEHNAEPRQVEKGIGAALTVSTADTDDTLGAIIKKATSPQELRIQLELEMQKASEALDFERAIEIRDMLNEMK